MNLHFTQHQNRHVSIRYYGFAAPSLADLPDLMLPSSRMTPPQRAYMERLLASLSLSPSLFSSSCFSLIFSQFLRRNTRCFSTKFLVVRRRQRVEHQVTPHFRRSNLICYKVPANFELARNLKEYTAVKKVIVCMFIVPLSVGHGLHEMRVELVAVTRLFLL